MELDELAIIDSYFRPLAGEGGFKLLDDAARLTVPPDCDLVITADMIAVGVHFLPGDPPETIARKALRVNISDLAAKGARPLAYMLAIGLRPEVTASWLAGFSQGLRTDQAEFGMHLIGGDTIRINTGPVISITAFGLVETGRMVHRFGGRPGDALYLTGAVGGAAAGLAVLTGAAGPWDAISAAERDRLVGRYRIPEPRHALAAALVAFANAAMDVSDGLIGDCDKLARASGCSAVIEAERVPLPAGLEHVRGGQLAMLLAGGDDYEILAAVPPESEQAFRAAAGDAAVSVTRIGELTEGATPTQLRFDGASMRVDKRSYVHGRGEDS